MRAGEGNGRGWCVLGSGGSISRQGKGGEKAVLAWAKPVLEEKESQGEKEEKKESGRGGESAKPIRKGRSSYHHHAGKTIDERGNEGGIHLAMSVVNS